MTLSVVNIKNMNNLINRINTFTSNIFDPDDVIATRQNLQYTYISDESCLDIYCLAENMSHIPGTNGEELWCYDDSIPIQQYFNPEEMDIYSGSHDSWPMGFIVYNNKLYFDANGG